MAYPESSDTGRWEDMCRMTDVYPYTYIARLVKHFPSSLTSRLYTQPPFLPPCFHASLSILDLWPPLASVLTIPFSPFTTLSLFSIHVYVLSSSQQCLSFVPQDSVTLFAISFLQKLWGEKWILYALSINQSSDDKSCI